MIAKIIRKLLRSICVHLTIILGIVLMTLLIIDVFFNDAMNFVNNGFFKWASMIFIVCSVSDAGMLLHGYSKKKKRIKDAEPK